jgi:hypothetical protein
MVVRLFVDASYGVHKDGKSHTGSCVVLGEVGAVHCTSSKQDIVVKSSTEGELVAASNSANQGLHSRQFLIAQGYKMGPVIMYQDNLSQDVWRCLLEVGLVRSVHGCGLEGRRRKGGKSWLVLQRGRRDRNLFC